MTPICRLASLVAFVVAVDLITLAAGPRQQPPTPAQQPTEITTTLTGAGGAPQIAVPAFVPLTRDEPTVAAARTLSQVLSDDLTFEREFSLIPRDTYASIPAATSFDDVPFDRWRELNIDGLIIGTVQVTDNVLTLEVRLLNVRTRQQAFGRRYTGSPTDPRLYAHTVSDELHQQQRALRGVARTKLTFVSDRDGDRLAGTIEDRGVKEVYFSDYDGENQRRLTVGRTLNITPVWSPDGRSIAYTSYRRGVPNIFISNIYQGTLEEMTKGTGNNYLPSWSPDGKRLCFTSSRDGNPELYVANRDGSNVVRLTNHPAIDGSPTWSPSGTQIAFTSDRSGSPQIYVIDADGLGLQKITSESYTDRPTWSPPPYNEIAFTARAGRTLDLKVINMATREIRQLTFGEGDNESPAWAPNGRHLAFVSTRAGRKQIFTMAGDGKNLRQITRSGNNSYPDWSK